MPWWFWTFTPIVGFILCGAFFAYLLIRATVTNGGRTWREPDWASLDMEDAGMCTLAGYALALIWPVTLWLGLTMLLTMNHTHPKVKPLDLTISSESSKYKR